MEFLLYIFVLLAVIKDTLTQIKYRTFIGSRYSDGI